MGGIAQIMITAAVRFAPISALAPFDYLQIVWAMLWGFLLFDAFPTWNGVVGGMLIGSGGCYVIWRERRTRTIVVPSSNEL
jgi:drug/metabolite transporter (DMT)-like permease